jgi:WD40 repeat protein
MKVWFRPAHSIDLNVVMRRVRGTKQCVFTMHRQAVLGKRHGSDSNTAGKRYNEMLFRCCSSLSSSSSLDIRPAAFDIGSIDLRREGPTMLPQVHEGSIAACQMSDDAKLLVTGGYDLRVVLWDIEAMAHKLVLRVR